MGSHTWTDTCPHCGFKEMSFSTFNSYFEIICAACGYEKWTEEKEPKPEDVELAKIYLSKMSVEQQEELSELHKETGKPLIVRLKEEKQNKI